MSERNAASPHIAIRRDQVSYPVPTAAAKGQAVRASGGPRDPGEPEQNLTATFVLNTLRRWWLVATPVGILLAALAATVVYLMFQPMFEADALFRIEEHAPFLAFQSKSEERSRAFFQTQIELIRSRAVIAPVIARPEITRIPEIQQQRDKIAWLCKQIKVSQVPESELFRIAYANPDPENAAKVVDAVTQEYFKLRDKKERERVEGVIKKLEQEKLTHQKELAAKQEEVRQLAKAVTGTDPFVVKRDPDTPQRRSTADLQSQIIAAQVDQAVLKARLEAMEEELTRSGTKTATAPDASPPPKPPALSPREIEIRDAMVEQVIEQYAEVQKQKAVLSAKQAKLNEVGTKSAKGKAAPEYQLLAKEIARDEKALEGLRNELRPRALKDTERAVEAQRMEQIAALEAKREEAETNYALRRQEEIDKLRLELKSREIMVKRLTEEYEKEQAKITKDTGDLLTLVFKRDEVARAERVFELIAQRALELQTERDAPERVWLQYGATPPLAPVEMFPYRNMVLGGLGGFLLPFGLALLWERLLRRVSGPEFLEQQSRLAVLGEIARLPTRVRTADISFSRQQLGEAVRIYEESVDSLRTSLTLAEDLRGMKVLAVTSAANHEGKTSVAVQLAVSIARATGERVLLLDGDMRSPDIHHIFSVPLEPGLVKVLSKECALEDAIVTTWNDRVHLLPAGKLSASPHKLLGNGVWSALMENIRSKYCYIVIDTPPVLAASEALVLAKGADASLLCVMRDVSRIDQVKKARERLAAAGTRPVGAVLNGVPTAHYAYRYGTYAYSQE